MDNDTPPPPYSVHDPVNISRPGPPQQPTVFSSLVDVASNLNLLINGNSREGPSRITSSPLPRPQQPPSWTSTPHPSSQPSSSNTRLLKKRPSVPPSPSVEGSLLHQLVTKEKISQIKLLLEKGVETIEAANQKGETPLFVSVSKGDKKTAKLLLEYGANPLIRPAGSESCLHVAITNNRKEIVKSLVERIKGDLSVIDERNVKGETPLYVAVSKGYKACIEILLNAGADPMSRPKGGDAMIHLAVKQDSCEIVKMLIRHGVDIEEMKDGETPLYRALSKNHTSLFKVLLSHGASAITPTSQNDRALSLAVSRGDNFIVSLLLAQPGIPSTINIPNPEGQTVLWTAISQNRTSIADLLLRSGADASLHPPHSESCLNLAVGKGSTTLVYALLERGADFDERNRKGDSPVIQAVNRSDASVLNTLLSKGADANARNKEGESALKRAVEKGNATLTSLLLAYGANPNADVGRGDDPVLFTAISKSNATLVSILLANNANPSTPSSKGRLPLDQAISTSNTTIVSILLSHGADVRGMTKDGLSMYEYAVRMGDRTIMSLLETYDKVRGPKVPEKDGKC